MSQFGTVALFDSLKPMKPTSLIIASAALTALSLSSIAFAAAGAGPKARLFAQYDTNKNGVIDGDEIAALRKAFADEPKGALHQYDSNGDGKLDDKEIAAIKPPGGGGKKGEGKKKEGEKKEDEDKEKTGAPTEKPAEKK